MSILEKIIAILGIGAVLCIGVTLFYVAVSVVMVVWPYIVSLTVIVFILAALSSYLWSK